MDGHFLLRVLLALEVILLAAILVVVFTHAVWGRVAAPRAAAALEPARRALARLGDAGAEGEVAVALSRLRPRLRVRLLSEAAPSLTGEHRQRLSSVAVQTGMIALAERLCSSPLWWRRLRGVRLLSLLGGGGRSVPRLFHDSHFAVRAEAVSWAAGNPDPDVIESLVALLADPGAVGGWTLRDALLRIGPPVVPPLADYLSRHRGRAALSALEVAAGLPDPRFTAPARRLASDRVPEVRARAATLLGALGGDEAVAALVARLDDPDAGVRAAAAEAVGRLGHWPAAPILSRLLRDQSWAVRSHSALSLRRLGGPGALMLQRALGDADPFAADIARQVLDLPPLVAAS